MKSGATDHPPSLPFGDSLSTCRQPWGNQQRKERFDWREGGEGCATVRRFWVSGERVENAHEPEDSSKELSLLASSSERRSPILRTLTGDPVCCRLTLTKFRGKWQHRAGRPPALTEGVTLKMGEEYTAPRTTSERKSRNQDVNQILDRIGLLERCGWEFSRSVSFIYSYYFRRDLSRQ